MDEALRKQKCPGQHVDSHLHHYPAHKGGDRRWRDRMRDWQPEMEGPHSRLDTETGKDEQAGSKGSNSLNVPSGKSPASGERMGPEEPSRKEGCPHSGRAKVDKASVLA